VNEVIACYREAIKLGVNDAGVHANLGNAFSRQGKFDEALASFRKATEVAPQHAGALNNLAWFLVTTKEVRLRDPREGLVLARRAAAIDPSWNNLDTLAEAAFLSQQWQESLGASRKLNRPDDIRPHPIANAAQQFATTGVGSSISSATIGAESLE